MIRIIKDLKWLSANKDRLKEMLAVIDDMKKEKPKKEERNYSLAGVPEYQLDYINDILEADKK